MIGKAIIKDIKLIKIKTNFLSDLFFPKYRNLYILTDGTMLLCGETMLDYPLYDDVHLFKCFDTGRIYGYSDRSDAAKASYNKRKSYTR